MPSIARTGGEKQVGSRPKKGTRKMVEHRNYNICIENWTETKDFSVLYDALREAEKEVADRKLEAEISINIRLSKSAVSFR